MLTREINSLQHPIVKHLFKVHSDRHYRQSENSAIVLGKKIIFELPGAIQIKTLLLAEDLALPQHLKADQLFRVPVSILKKISGAQTPEPIAAEVSLPPMSDLTQKNYLIALDGVSDPGNLGTLLRSALALGWEGAFITTGSTDPFNDKALRAAKGATFRLPLRIGSLDELEELARTNHINICIADLAGAPLQKNAAAPPLLLVFGNESKGVSPRLKKGAKTFCIPMQGKMDSLNVAAAAAIFMYVLKG